MPQPQMYLPYLNTVVTFQFWCVGTFSKSVLLDQVVPVSLSLNFGGYGWIYISVQLTGWIKSHTTLPDKLGYANNNHSHVCSTAESTYSFLLLGFETGSQVSEAGLELLILLPLPPECGDGRHLPPYLFLQYSGLN